MRLASAWLRGLKAVLAQPAEVYHFHDFELMPTALLAKMFLGKHVVYDAHEDVALILAKEWVPGWLKRPLAAVVKRLDRLCAHRLDGIVTVTRRLYERYRRVARRAVLFVNYPAPAFLEHREVGWRPYEDRSNEIVHLGTLSFGRLRFVVRVAERFLEAHPGWTWALLGLHEPQLQWFRDNVQGSGTDRLSAVGKMPHAEVAERLCRARIGINYHPLGSKHIQVAIPLKVFEYLACGLPVLTTRVPLLVELVEDCEAVVCADEDQDTYLAALSSLAERDDLDRLSGEARRFSDRRFNCRAETRRLASLYEDICAQD